MVDLINSALKNSVKILGAMACCSVEHVGPGALHAHPADAAGQPHLLPLAAGARVSQPRHPHHHGLCCHLPPHGSHRRK
jgi:hypothetical protein